MSETDLISYTYPFNLLAFQTLECITVGKLITDFKERENPWRNLPAFSLQEHLDIVSTNLWRRKYRWSKAENEPGTCFKFTVLLSVNHSAFLKYATTSRVLKLLQKGSLRYLRNLRAFWEKCIYSMFSLHWPDCPLTLSLLRQDTKLSLLYLATQQTQNFKNKPHSLQLESKCPDFYSITSRSAVRW